MGQLSFFDEENRMAKISKLGDPLERLDKVIDWKKFVPLLNKAMKKEKKERGRPHYPYLMMFKILIVQRLYNLSDEQMEFQLNDRRTFSRFVGLEAGNSKPDAKTIWLFRDTLTKSGKIDKIFDKFNEQLEKEHIITRRGSIVDATFVEAPILHNTPDENKKIKEGQTPESWEEAEKAHKKSQKDVDARWTKKGDDTYYGYKDHVKVDAESKIIISYETTPANVHDSRVFLSLLDNKDRKVYADSAYWSKEIEKLLPELCECQVHEKGSRYVKLTELQQLSNRMKSKIRVRVEHVFGFMTNSMHGLTLRSIGLARAKFNVALTNLVYNMCRYETIKRYAE